MSISLLSLGNILRALFVLLLTKLVAFSYGPAGLVALGSLQNILGILGPVSSLGANTSTILLISKSKPENLSSVFYTLIVLLLFGSLIGIILLFLLLPYFVSVMPDNVELNVTILVIYCLSSSIFALAAGYLQGRTLITSFAYGAIVGSGINFLFLFWAFTGWPLNSMINLIAFQMFINAIVLLYIIRKYLLKLISSLKEFQFKLALPLLQVGALSLASGLMLSIGFIYIRQEITEDFGLATSGNWDAAIRTFPIIMLLICLPIFSRYFSTLCKIGKKNELVSIYRTIITITLVPFSLGLSVVFLFPTLIVNLLFSDSFIMYMETITLFVIGDIIRAYAAIFNYFNLASLKYFHHFIGEVSFIAILVLLVNIMPISNFHQLALLYITASAFTLVLVGIFFISQTRKLSVFN